jgi:hypothetical protein
MPAYFQFSPRTLELFEAGKLEEGLEVSLELLALARQRGNDQEVVLQHLDEVAEFSLRLEQFKLAIDARQEMLARQELLAENKVSEGVVVEVSRLGFYYHLDQQFGLSKEYLERGLELIQQLPAEQRREFPGLFINNCHLAWKQGNLVEAMARLMTAWKMHNRFTPRWWPSEFALHRGYGRLLQEMGEWKKASKKCQITLQAFDTPDFPKYAYLSLSHVHYLRGILHWHDQERDAALNAYQRSLELLRQAPRRYPFQEERAVEKCTAAFAKLQAAQ